MSDNKLRNFFKGSAILIGGNIVIKAINFFLLPLYTKYLTPEELGISDSVTSLTAVIMPLLMMGLDSAFSAFYFDERNESHKTKLIATTSRTLLLSGLVPFVIMLFNRQISELLFHSPSYGTIISIALVTISFNLWYTPYALYIRMENRMMLFAAIQVTASLSMILLNIFFVSILKWGALSLVLSSAIVQLIQLVLFTVGARIRTKFAEFDYSLLKSMLKYSLPLIPTVIAAWFLNLSDRYMLLHYLSEYEVGIYGVAARFATVMAVLSNGVFVAYTSFAFDKKDDDDAKEQYKHVLSIYFMLMLLLCTSVSIWGKEIVRCMADSKYALSYILIPGLLFGQLMYGVSTIVGYGSAFAKKTINTMIATLLGAISNVVLNILFIPRFGVEAATYTTFAGYFIMMGATYLLAQRVYKCDYDIEKVLALTCIAFVASFACTHMIHAIAVKLIISVVLIALVIVLYRGIIVEILEQVSRLVKRRKNSSD